VIYFLLQVPSIPWSGSFGGPGDGPLVAELNEEGLIPDEIFRKAQVTTVEEALDAVSIPCSPVHFNIPESAGTPPMGRQNSHTSSHSHLTHVAPRPTALVTLLCLRLPREVVARVSVCLPMTRSSNPTSYRLVSELHLQMKAHLSLP
jgi:hypothetical protein